MVVLNPSTISHLLDNNLADKLTSRICDSKSEIRAAACSLTKTVCQMGGESVCDYLVSEEILTPVLDLFSKMKVTMSFVDPEIAKPYHSILQNVLGVMHELCQGCQAAVDVVSVHPQIGNLLDYLDFANQISFDLRCAAGNVLQDLVEDSVVYESVSNSARAKALLENCLKCEDKLLQCICAGICFEIDSNFARCIECLDPVFRLPLQEGLLSLQSLAVNTAAELAQEEEQGDAMQTSDQPQKDGPAATLFNNAANAWSRSAKAQQQAFETLANILGSLPENVNVDQNLIDRIFPYIKHTCSLDVSKIDAQLGDRLLMVMPRLDGCVDQLQTLQLRALNCYNNGLIGGAAPAMKQHAEVMWNGLMSMLEVCANSLEGVEGNEDELLDSIAQCLWSIARAYGGDLKATPEHLASILNVLSAHRSSLCDVSLAGVLGCLVPLYNANEAIVTSVVNVLVQCATGGGAKILMIAESLNSIVDLFSDDKTHAFFVKLQIDAGLKSLVPNVNALLKNPDPDQVTSRSFFLFFPIVVFLPLLTSFSRFRISSA
jgi:hypothetical protein